MLSIRRRKTTLRTLLFCLLFTLCFYLLKKQKNERCCMNKSLTLNKNFLKFARDCLFCNDELLINMFKKLAIQKPAEQANPINFQIF
jgi:hypothetical protein